LGCEQAESRKSELEVVLSTNLVKRQQELQAQLAASDSQSLMQDVEVRKQDLKDAKTSVDEAVQQLKCMYHMYL
jgi:structural maintenance of chromosome 3 (chondroitin sulfate proteoglycan 6)